MNEKSLNNKMPLSSLRLRKDMTQQEVADILQVHRVTVSEWENDASNMTMKFAIKLAELYEYSMDKTYYGPKKEYWDLRRYASEKSIS